MYWSSSYYYNSLRSQLACLKLLDFAFCELTKEIWCIRMFLRTRINLTAEKKCTTLFRTTEIWKRGINITLARFTVAWSVSPCVINVLITPHVRMSSDGDFRAIVFAGVSFYLLCFIIRKSHIRNGAKGLRRTSGGRNRTPSGWLFGTAKGGKKCIALIFYPVQQVAWCMSRDCVLFLCTLAGRFVMVP